MIIDADSDSEEAAVDAAVTDVAGTAYRESMVSVDGFTRGPNGKIKFHKDTKKRRREEETIQDVEMVDAEEVTGSKPKKSKKKSEVSFGHEFKAKVCSFGQQTIIWKLMVRFRKLAVMSRRVGWTHMPIFRFLKQQNLDVGMVLQANDDLYFLDLTLSHTFFSPMIICIDSFCLSIHIGFDHEVFQTNHPSSCPVASSG